MWVAAWTPSPAAAIAFLAEDGASDFPRIGAAASEKSGGGSYCTTNVSDAECEPEVAEAVTLTWVVPAGVPVTGGLEPEQELRRPTGNATKIRTQAMCRAEVRERILYAARRASRHSAARLCAGMGGAGMRRSGAEKNCGSDPWALRAVVETVSWRITGWVPSRATGGSGENAQIEAAGRGAQEKFKVCVEPLSGVTVMAVVPDCPAGIVNILGEAEMVKSGAALTTWVTAVEVLAA
jgi:hypothetical protein